jgi:hypothetical protein
MNSSSQSPPLHNGSKAQVKLRTIKLFTAALSEQIATQNSKLQPSRETLKKSARNKKYLERKGRYFNSKSITISGQFNIFWDK